MKRRCLLIGSRGFLGSQIERILQAEGVDVVGTTRALRRDDPASWLKYSFPHDSIRNCVGDRCRFDFVIIAARLARANIEAKPASGTEALPFDKMFDELRRYTERITYLSSDAVFSGKRGQYLETDQPDACEPYGAMQTTAEKSISTNTLNHLIVRTSFLYDVDNVERDRRLSQLQKAVRSRTQFFGDTNVYKSPVKVVDAAQAVVEGTLANQTGILHVPEKRKSIYDFFDTSLSALGLSSFKKYLVARQSAQSSDTSLSSVF